MFSGSFMFSGSIVALITPFDQEGNIDFGGLKGLVEHHIQSETDAIVAMGTTGESATLSPQEHIEVVRKTVEFAQGRIPVIAGAGSNDTAYTVNMIEQMNSLNLAGYLSVTPYYNKPTQEGLYQHYSLIAEAANYPVILYNVPGRTGVDLLPETVGRLAKLDNIVALKDATGDLSRVEQHKQLCSDEFILLSGDDATALEFTRLGGFGTISVTANIAAKQMAMVYQAYFDGDEKRAKELDDSLQALHRDLFVESNPTPVKWVALQLGLIKHNVLRLPLMPLTEDSQPILKQAMLSAGMK